MFLGDEKETRRDDGSIFLTRQVKIHGVGTYTNVVVVNDQIAVKARSLLPVALAMSNSKKMRLDFLRTSGDGLMVSAGAAYACAENESWQAALRLSRLKLLSSGDSVAGGVVVLLDDWIAILEFFAQELSVGSINAIGG